MVTGFMMTWRIEWRVGEIIEEEEDEDEDEEDKKMLVPVNATLLPNLTAGKPRGSPAYARNNRGNQRSSVDVL